MVWFWVRSTNDKFVEPGGALDLKLSAGNFEKQGTSHPYLPCFGRWYFDEFVGVDGLQGSDFEVLSFFC